MATASLSCFDTPSIQMPTDPVAAPFENRSRSTTLCHTPGANAPRLVYDTVGDVLVWTAAVSNRRANSNVPLVSQFSANGGDPL